MSTVIVLSQCVIDMQVYTIFLDLALLVLPLILMILAYGRIIVKLVHGSHQLNDEDHTPSRRTSALSNIFICVLTISCLVMHAYIATHS